MQSYSEDALRSPNKADLGVCERLDGRPEEKAGFCNIWIVMKLAQLRPSAVITQGNLLLGFTFTPY